MTLNQLEYALAIKQNGSFNKASEKLGISQPALSMQIQKLEDETGIRLFDRSRTPIQPTVDGQQFLERADELMASAQQLAKFSSSLAEGYKGTLKVGIIPTLAPYLVPLFAEHLQTDFPEFQLDIYELITEKVVHGIRNGQLDVGILATPIHAYGMHYTPLFYEKFYLYASEKNLHTKLKVDLKEINYEELWLLEEGNCFRDQINNFCDLEKIRKGKRFVFRSNSIDALIRIVDTKGGMTILPELSTLSLTEEQEVYVKTISGPTKAREISLLMRTHYDKKRFIDKMGEYILKNVPKNMHTSSGLEIVDPDIHIS